MGGPQNSGGYIFSVYFIAPRRVPPELQLGDQIAIVSHPRANARVFRDVHEIDGNTLRSELDPVTYDYRTTCHMNSPIGEQAGDLNSDLSGADVKMMKVANDGIRTRSGAGINKATACGRVASSPRSSLRGQCLLVLALRRRDHASSSSVYPSARR